TAAGDPGRLSLELDPPRLMRADLRGGQGGILGVDEDRLAGCFGQELRMATPLHGDEPPRGFIDAMADSEQSVVAHDDRLVLTQRRGDTLPFYGFVNDAGEVLEKAVVLEK